MQQKCHVTSHIQAKGKVSFFLQGVDFAANKIARFTHEI